MNFRNFIKNRSGSVALITALMSVPIMGAVGASFDYAIMRNIQSALQNSADSAVLASTKELGIPSNRESTIKEIAKQYVIASLSNGFNFDKYREDLTIETEISGNRKSVTVNLALKWNPLILHYFNANAFPIRIQATASLAGNENICIVALGESGKSSLKINNNSAINATQCAVYSNHPGQRGILVAGKGNIYSSNTYTSGGYLGRDNSFSPRPITDSPAIVDPLKDRIPPKSTACTETNFVQITGTAILYPGTYCGGISIDGDTKLFLRPGEYIMKNGPLKVSGEATIEGKNTGFVFEGMESTFQFSPSSRIRLSAPVKGPLAGILFFENQKTNRIRKFTIKSRYAEYLEGTVYLPNGEFIAAKESRVGQASKWTAIIANKINVGSGAHLQLNSNYAGSNIPVPDGVGPHGTPRLTN